MRIVAAAEVANLLDYGGVIDAVQNMFRDGCVLPSRHHHTIPLEGGPSATLLLMPAWNDKYLGVKLATIHPGNSAMARAAVTATYQLSDVRTGELLALIDGGELTARRTVSASVLASTYLARPEASRLLVVGTGRLARMLPQAYAARFALKSVSVWGRNPGSANACASTIGDAGISARAVSNLRDAVAEADIIACATLSHTPLIKGDWLHPGQHIDLIGGFTPDMREADDTVISRAKVFVDTIDGATREAGDIVVPISKGIIRKDQIRDLFHLTRGNARGRENAAEITLFKSVGTALEDLAAATMLHARLTAKAL